MKNFGIGSLVVLVFLITVVPGFAQDSITEKANLLASIVDGPTAFNAAREAIREYEMAQDALIVADARLTTKRTEVKKFLASKKSTAEEARELLGSYETVDLGFAQALLKETSAMKKVMQVQSLAKKYLASSILLGLFEEIEEIQDKYRLSAKPTEDFYEVWRQLLDLGYGPAQ